MKLPPPPNEYSARDQREVRRQIEAADRLNQKVRKALQLQSPDGSTWEITIDSAGTLTATKL